MSQTLTKLRSNGGRTSNERHPLFLGCPSIEVGPLLLYIKTETPKLYSQQVL